MFLLLLAFFILLGMAGLWLLAVAWFVRRLALNWSDWTWRLRTSVFAAGLATVFAPYLVSQAWEFRTVHAFMAQRVPNPLEPAGIEYRLEESSGIGMPGDAETGFIVYRLTDESTQLARDSADELGAMLSDRDGEWYPTPVGAIGDWEQWHPYDGENMGYGGAHHSSIEEFLDKYGFGIPIKEDADADADRAIQEPGSFYSYGRGGSVTIVDPARGKVYFAYAG